MTKKSIVNITSDSNEGLCKALFSGSFPIGNINIQCAVLSDETRILSATSVFKAFGRSRKGRNSRLEIDGTNIPPFLASKNLEPYLTQEIIDRTKVIEYTDGNKIKSGYNSELLIDMCDIYLKARREGILTKSQEKIAVSAEILQTAFAKVGIAGVIDEATGYQKVRGTDALRFLLTKYIAEELSGWIKTFPDSFFMQLDKLYGNEKTSSKKRPLYYGKFINKYVYDPLESGYIKQELDRLNITDRGKRKARFHQWLTSDGRDLLIRQIGRIEGKAEIANSIEEFKELVNDDEVMSIAPDLFNEDGEIIT